MARLLFKSELELNFRGERDYIYGPDLFINSIESVFNYFETDLLSKVDFSSHAMAHQGLDFYLFDSPDEESLDLVQSKLVFTHKNIEYFAYLVLNGKTVSQRTPYPEEEVFDACILDKENKTIVLRKRTTFLLTDNYTALTKFMHKHIFPDTNGKWIFVRVIYNEYKIKQKYNELKVVCSKNFSNKFTQNALFIDGEKIGTIYFSLI
ncbi:MAG: hypothetical protein KAS71_11400 [Bacteroidales bacterium]|nr:hypothetical protein [Bacteroidales bacterium]